MELHHGRTPGSCCFDVNDGVDGALYEEGKDAAEAEILAISSSGIEGQTNEGGGASFLRFLLDNKGLLLTSSRIRKASFAALENDMKFSSLEEEEAEEDTIGSFHNGCWG